MHPAITLLEKNHRKPGIVPAQSGDTVRVHQLIKEGNKQRIQVFEGVVIRTHRAQELTACITVRRIASGVGVEKTFLLHSPNVSKVEVLRRAKVRRNFLSYLRERRGKSARLQEITFDKAAVNAAGDVTADDLPLDEELVDEEITEINPEATEEIVADVSIDDVAKAEDAEAATADPASDPGSDSDEQQLAAEEADSGVKKADNTNA